MLSRRQPLRQPAIKDPASETTAEANLRVRSATGARVASQRQALTRRQSAGLANRQFFLFRRNVRVDFPPGAGRIRVAGLLAAQRARRAVIQSAQTRGRRWRWVSYPDTTTYIGTKDFIEVARGNLTELKRKASFIVQV